MAQGVRELSFHEMMVRKLEKMASDPFCNLLPKHRLIARRMCKLVAQYHVALDCCSNLFGRDKDICSVLSSLDFVVRLIRTEREGGHDVSEISNKEIWDCIIPEIIRRAFSENMLGKANNLSADPRVAVFLTTKSISSMQKVCDHA